MMKKNSRLKQKKGISLIEILVALCVGTILVPGSYRVFVVQQKTYHVPLIENQILPPLLRAIYQNFQAPLESTHTARAALLTA